MQMCQRIWTRLSPTRIRMNALSAPNSSSSSASSPWQPVCQRRAASLLYLSRSYSLAVVWAAARVVGSPTAWLIAIHLLIERGSGTWRCWKLQSIAPLISRPLTDWTASGAYCRVPVDKREKAAPIAHKIPRLRMERH